MTEQRRKSIGFQELRRKSVAFLELRRKSVAVSEQRSVLIAMDESSHSDEAFDFYVKYVHSSNDRAVLLYVPEYHTVIQSHMVMTDVTVVTDLLHKEENRIKGFLEKLGNKMTKVGIGGRVKSVGGNPGEVVIKVANEEKCQLIVIGSRGNGTIRRTLLGSVSDYIMHHAQVPVLICKSQDLNKNQN